MKILREKNLAAKLKKYIQSKESVKYLRYMYLLNYIRADSDKQAKISRQELPKNPQEVRKFLELVNYLEPFKVTRHQYKLEKLVYKDVEWV